MNPDYSETLQWLESLDMWRMRPGFERTARLLGKLGNPHQKYLSVIVAGTNGKGSVAWNLARGAQGAGWRVGLLTSPHLQTPRERIRTGMEMIGEEQFSWTLNRIREIADNDWEPGLEAPSYYETVVSAGFTHFAKTGCEVVIAEVGLGGRLDTVNHLGNYGSVITSVDLDHTEHLGATISEIAAEKAAVIKGGICVVGDLRPAALKAVREICRGTGARMVQAPVTKTADYHTRNSELTMAAAAELFPGCASPQDFPSWQPPPGRSEKVPWGKGVVILEGAHNPAGAQASADFLRGEGGIDLVLAGVKKDKRGGKVIEPLAAIAERFILCRLPAGESFPPEKLAAAVKGEAEVIEDPDVAIGDFLGRISEGGKGLVFGSLYLAGAIRERLGLAPR